MTKESFDKLLSLIDDHPVFSNNSSCPQKPPKYQFQVTLYHYGGGATGSRMRTAIQFGIGEGTVHLYVRRVTEAILALQREYIRWPEPNSPEYAEIVGRHQLEYGFPNCLGFVDGTLVPVYRKPIAQGERYLYSQKYLCAQCNCIVNNKDSVCHCWK